MLHNVAIVVLVPSRVWPSVLEARWEDDCVGWDHEPCNHEFHRDPTQKLNQIKNFYYKNSHMEIK